MQIDDEYLKICDHEARSYARKAGLLHELDDIRQEAYLILCEYVAKGDKMHPPYFRQHLRWRLTKKVWFRQIDVPAQYRNRTRSALESFFKTESSDIARGLLLVYGPHLEYDAYPTPTSSTEEVDHRPHPDTMAELQEAVDKLTSEEVDLVRRYFSGVSLAEIGRELGLTRAALALRKDKILEKING